MKARPNTDQTAALRERLLSAASEDVGSNDGLAAVLTRLGVQDAPVGAARHASRWRLEGATNAKILMRWMGWTALAFSTLAAVHSSSADRPLLSPAPAGTVSSPQVLAPSSLSPAPFVESPTKPATPGSARAEVATPAPPRSLPGRPRKAGDVAPLQRSVPTEASNSPTIQEPLEVAQQLPPSASNQGTERPAPGDTLAREISELAAIRRAYMQGRATEAAVLLERYRHRFDHPILREEADGLEVLILSKRGNGTAAEQAGRAFLRTHPQSPLAPRIAKQLQGAAEQKD